ncbi:MAG: sulfatase-like hydrolase/transferase [Candidatus Glassbacteria bacterium]|nr:sulfatase-like hydrolase/transferase [Candidatus Glassbacteria bacterium]
MSSNLFGKQTISRRSFLAAAGTVPLAAALAGARLATNPGEQPNILIILTDQLAQKAVGAYGNRHVETPNIDELARGGVRFSKSYTNCPLCQPARAAMWTGRLPHTTGVNSNGMNYPVPTVSPRTPTMGEVFSEAGYEAVHFGKQHDAGSLRGFTLIKPEEEEHLESHPAWPVDYDSRRDVPTTRQVVDYLEQEHTRPFLAVASLNNPHDICNWIGSFEGEHEDIAPPGGELPPLPDNFKIKDLENRPRPIQYICCSHRRLRMASSWSEENYRHYLAAYYHYTKMVDMQVGQIIEALKASPEGRNTLVVFLSDHGDGMGAHRMVTKQVSFYEEMTRIPMIFAGPGIAGPGKLLNEPLVSLIDLFPTLCELASIKAPSRLPGISMAGWLHGDNRAGNHEYVVSEWETEWGYTVSPGRMLRTERYKYTCYLEGAGEELYDLEKDPGETRNLTTDRGYRDELEEHRRLLKEHTTAVRDPFFGQGVRVDKRWRSHKLGYQYHEGPSAPEAAWAEEEQQK